MLELSINLDELAFITLALGTLAFATLAVLATDIRTSVSGFLFAGLFVCTIAFCELPAEQSVVAVTLGITYLLISSLLLIMRKACCGSNTVEAKEKKLLKFW